MRRSVLLFAGFAALAACALFVTQRGTTASAPPDTGVPTAERAARIHPDYAGIVIPPNIAPLNFTVRYPGVKYCVDIGGDDGTPFVVFSDDGGMDIPVAKWKALLDANRGGNLYFNIYVKAESGKWKRFDRIVNRVSEDEIDGYLVYREMPAFNLVWENMSIRQRNIETFDEKIILHNNSYELG